MKNMKKAISLFLALVAAFIPVATTLTDIKVNAATTENVNYALNATVTTSSNENDSLIGNYAVDGDSSTRWSSAWRDGEWIMFDLGAIYTIGCVNIEWEAAYASTYTLMWSQDNVTWYTASTSNIHSADRTTNMFYNRPVRYIKLVCDKRATVYGSSLYEFEAIGTAGQKTEVTTEATTETATTEITTEAVTETTTEVPTTETTTEQETTTEEVITSTTNLALGKVAVSSSNESNEFLAANAVDGDSSTRWSSAWRDGEWIMVDLGKLYTVGCVTIDWEAAFASNYTISWSQDNVTWYDAVNFTTKSASSETHMMYNRPIRYIKITANTRGTSYGASIYDISVLGSAYNAN